MPRYIATVEFSDPETDINTLMRGESISLCLAPEGSKLRLAMSTPERWYRVNLKQVEDRNDDDRTALVGVARVD